MVQASQSPFLPLSPLVLPYIFLLPANPLLHNFCCLGDISDPDTWTPPPLHLSVCPPPQTVLLLSSHPGLLQFTQFACPPRDVQPSAGHRVLRTPPPGSSLEIRSQAASWNGGGGGHPSERGPGVGTSGSAPASYPTV